MSDVLLKQAKTQRELANGLRLGNLDSLYVRLEVAEQQIQKQKCE